MIGGAWSSSLSRIAFANSSPFMTGIMKSVITSAGRSR
jgi:hypothetical protein